MSTAVTVVFAEANSAAVSALIAVAGKSAALRFLEFFTVNIRTPNTRAAYKRAAAAFLGWCETRAGLGQVQPIHVAAYIEELQGKFAAPTVKQHLACLRMLFDWLVTGQVIPTNPARSVRGPRYSVSKGVSTTAPGVSSWQLARKPRSVRFRERAPIGVLIPLDPFLNIGLLETTSTYLQSKSTRNGRQSSRRARRLYT